MSGLQLVGVAVIVLFFGGMAAVMSWVSQEWWVGPVSLAFSVVLTAVLVGAIFLALGWRP